MELPLPSQSYQTRSKPLSSQRLVNLYCEVYKDDNGVLRTKSLLGTPGLVENIDFELSTPIYGASFFKNKIVFCIKNRVFEYDKNAEEKIFTVYDWNIFVQPAMYANNTYGLMSDSKNTNNTYKITETSVMEGGVYPDEQGITISTAPDYFVKNSDLPYIVKWKFTDTLKITSLSISTRLLPQNFITARFYLDEDMAKPIGDMFNNNANDGVDKITVANIPAEGVETNVIYLAILSMQKNPNSSCNVVLSNYHNFIFSTNTNNTKLSYVYNTNTSSYVKFNNKYYFAKVSLSTKNHTVYVSSDNGITWTEEIIGTSNDSYSYHLATNGSIMLAMIGGNKKSSYGYFTTTDGSTWTERKTFPNSVTINGITSSDYSITGINYINGYFVAGATLYKNPHYYSFILYSTDGINWTQGVTYKSTNGYYYSPTSTDGYIYNNGYYYWINTSTQKAKRKAYLYRSATLDDLSTNEHILLGESVSDYQNATSLTCNSNGDIYACTSTGLWKVSDDLSVKEKYFDGTVLSCCSYNSTRNMVVCGGPDGIFNAETLEQYSTTSALGIFFESDTQIYTISSEYQTSGVWTEITDSVPYIKLDSLTITAEKRGNLITSFTRKYRQLGVIEDLSNYVDMVDDGDHLFLLHSNGKGYYIEENSDGKLELKEVQDDSVAGFEYQKLKSVCYLAGRFIGVDYSAGTIRWTEILNPNGWNTLNYIQSETSINELTAVRSNTREAWVFSPKNIEVYTPTGSSDSPSAFARVSGAYIDKGCKYKNCIAMNQNQFYWVATDGCIYRSNGYNAEKISTVALENEIMNYGEQEDILGQIYTQAGHVFYVVKFKTAKKTWCYDITTGLWHERESNDSEWKGDLIISAWNHIYVSDKDKSILYDLDLDVGTDNGDVIKREFVFPTIKNEELRTFHRRLEIDMDTGFSNKEHLFLQYSDDGGYTWSNEYWVNLGEKAEYNRKLEWRRLGSAITRIYRVRMSTINRVNIIGAYIDMKKGVA